MAGEPRKRTTARERFEAGVDRSGGPDACHMWTAGSDRRGYGWFSAGGRTIRAHRFSYEMAKGPIPDGLCVCHTCDVPLCVNPGHLWLGTRLDNNRDRALKGRNGDVRGSRHGGAMLTEERVATIKRRLSAGERVSTVAADEGVSQGAIHNIRTGLTWGHVQSTADILRARGGRLSKKDRLALALAYASILHAMPVGPVAGIVDAEDALRVCRGPGVPQDIWRAFIVAQRAGNVPLRLLRARLALLLRVLLRADAGDLGEYVPVCSVCHEDRSYMRCLARGCAWKPYRMARRVRPLWELAPSSHPASNEGSR